jgi:hypothetical protein
VVGVLPESFRLPPDYGADGRTEAWVPLAADAVGLVLLVACANVAGLLLLVAVTGLVVLAASVGPARRAARTNPAAVLHKG